MNNVLFIGLGNMGFPMAEQLLSAGFKVFAFDIFEAPVQALSAKGAVAVPDIVSGVSEADVVITMLANSQQVEDVYCEKEGLLDAVSEAVLLIDCSTIDHETTSKIANKAKEKGLKFVDAPVSGGTAGAASGQLTFMMGGDTKAVELARPVLLAMGSQFFHAGASGNGQLAKQCNNMLLAILMTGTAEVLALANKVGLDSGVISEIMKHSSGNNWVLQHYNPVPHIMENTPASADYQGGFKTSLMLKDLTLALNTSSFLDGKCPMGQQARAIYNTFTEENQAELAKDFSVVYRYYTC